MGMELKGEKVMGLVGVGVGVGVVVVGEGEGEGGSREEGDYVYVYVYVSVQFAKRVIYDGMGVGIYLLCFFFF